MSTEVKRSSMEFDSSSSYIKANPSARRLAREIGIDLSEVKAASQNGRITKDDVKCHAKQLNQSSVNLGQNRHSIARSLPDFGQFGEYRREAMSKIAKVTSVNMMNSWAQIPHAWLQQAIDISDLELWRQQHKSEVANQGGALTITVILAKAVAAAMKKFPIINSSYDEQTNEIVFKEYVDIGIAVDTDNGLLVPSLRQVDKKSISVIARELKVLSEKAYARKLIPGDLQGAGTTVSNLGGIGLSAIFPIINWPQVAILGVAESSIQARFHDGVFVPRRILTVTLGFDHRVINGAEGGRFLVHLKSLLEDIRLILL